MPKWMDSARDFLGLGEDPYYDDDYDLIDEDVLEDPVETPDPPARTRAPGEGGRARTRRLGRR